jgi:uncharacterized membrane protein HdeD (DUF308 family)
MRVQHDLELLSRPNRLEPALQTQAGNPVLSCWPQAARAALAVGFGLAALLAPSLAVRSLAFAFGAYALADGVLAITAASLAPRGRDRWRLLFVEGLADLVAGATALLLSSLRLVELVVLMAVWAVVSGAALGAAGLLLPVRRGRNLVALSGLASLLWGLAVLLSPVEDVVALVAWLAVYALVLGVLLMVLTARLSLARR